MRAAAHRVISIFVALALALSAPIGTSRRCDRCPVDCPMHRQGSGSHPLGCHHGMPASADTGSELKCACGHLPAATPGTTLRGLPPRLADAGPMLAGRPVAERASLTVSRAAPAPPSEPPRPSLV